MVDLRNVTIVESILADRILELDEREWVSLAFVFQHVNNRRFVSTVLDSWRQVESFLHNLLIEKRITRLNAKGTSYVFFAP